MASSTCVFEFKHLADTFHVFWQSYRNFNLATGNQSQWVPSRMASFPAAFRISCASPLCVPLEILFIFATASFCRLAASLMFAICFCSSRFFWSFFISRARCSFGHSWSSKVLSRRFYSFLVEGILCNRQLHVSKSKNSLFFGHN